VNEAADAGVPGEVYERAAEMFALLGTALRLRLMNLLCDREMNVGELSAALACGQPSVSQNLGLLYRAGLLARQRRGAQTYYRVNPAHSLLLCDAVRSLLRGQPEPAR
jgi:ArsR family transcriptional regulator